MRRWKFLYGLYEGCVVEVRKAQKRTGGSVHEDVQAEGGCVCEEVQVASGCDEDGTQNQDIEPSSKTRINSYQLMLGL